MAQKDQKSSDHPNVGKRPRLLCDMPIPQISESVGMLFVCGQGEMGQLGLGEDQMERKRPTHNASVKNIVDICAGGMHSLCLTKEGIVYSFGCNDEGALGRETNDDGSEFTPAKIDLPGKCVKISAGDSHSACLLEDGRVFACGSFRNSHGNMGLTLEGNKRLPFEVLPGIKSCDIASGADHLVILTCSGKVYTIGCGEQGQLGRVALRSASGDSRRGKTDLLTPGCVSISRGKLSQKIWATNYCSFVKEFNGDKIYAFGLNNYNQLGIKKTKEVEVRPTETSIEKVENIVGGQQHTLILTTDKKCYAIGKSDYGRLGISNIKEDVEQFKEVETLSNKNLMDISCGDSQSFAITNDGKLYAWGMGSSYQLGTGNEDDELEPVLIVSKATQDKKFLKVSSGGQHTLFLIEDKTNDSTQSNGLSKDEDTTISTKKDDVPVNMKKNENISDKENKIKKTKVNVQREKTPKPNENDEDKKLTTNNIDTDNKIKTANQEQLSVQQNPVIKKGRKRKQN